MNYNFINMNRGYANKIKTWEYEGEYSIYSYINDECLLDENNWNCIFAVLDEDNNLIAEVTFYNNDAPDELEHPFTDFDMFYGQGMKPNFTGRGYGPELVSQSIKFGIEYFNYKRKFVYLDVLTFNKRAFKAYKKAGFEFVKEYSEEYEGDVYEFIRMRYKNPKAEV